MGDRQLRAVPTVPTDISVSSSDVSGARRRAQLESGEQKEERTRINAEISRARVDEWCRNRTDYFAHSDKRKMLLIDRRAYSNSVVKNSAITKLVMKDVTESKHRKMPPRVGTAQSDMTRRTWVDQKRTYIRSSILLRLHEPKQYTSDSFGQMGLDEIIDAITTQLYKTGKEQIFNKVMGKLFLCRNIPMDVVYQTWVSYTEVWLIIADKLGMEIGRTIPNQRGPNSWRFDAICRSIKFQATRASARQDTMNPFLKLYESAWLYTGSWAKRYRISGEDFEFNYSNVSEHYRQAHGQCYANSANMERVAEKQKAAEKKREKELTKLIAAAVKSQSGAWKRPRSEDSRSVATDERSPTKQKTGKRHLLLERYPANWTNLGLKISMFGERMDVVMD